VSVIYDTFRRIDQQREQNRPTDGANLRLVQSRESRNIMMSRARGRSFKVLTVSSNKGGVGKSTISSNLAVYFRALREDLPILIFGLDDQSILDRMFCLDDQDHDQTVATGLRTGDFSSVIRLGQYGVHYIPSAPNASDLKSEIQNPLCVLETLQRTNWNGVVIIDTKSDRCGRPERSSGSSTSGRGPAIAHASCCPCSTGASSTGTATISTCSRSCCGRSARRASRCSSPSSRGARRSSRFRRTRRAA
jgi:hypothetical protein